MWLLKYFNPDTGPYILICLVVSAAIIYYGAQKIVSGRMSEWLCRVAKLLGFSGLLIGIFTTVLYLPFSLISCFIFDNLLGDWRNEIDLQGVVVDKESRAPISNARIIVHAESGWYMNCMQYNYATISNEVGEFTLITQLPEPCNRITLSASSSEDHFAHAQWESASVTLESAPLEGVKASLDKFRYDEFRGYSITENINFFCDPWMLDELQTD